MKILQHLLKAVRDAALFNPEVQVAPACILWPDQDHQWEAVIPRLQGILPEFLILGNYNPTQRSGPAIWLRCAIANLVKEVSLPPDIVPIIYLPGISRQDLRAIENCPDNLKPLAELQYRGVIWSQINNKDWTILAFLKSDQGGLGLDVAQDNASKQAMQLALSLLLDEVFELLQGKKLDHTYFNTLLTGGDPVRDLLKWLDQEDAFVKAREESEWKAFVEVCKSLFAFNPQSEGIITAAASLANRAGPWRSIWERYCEAPKLYPNIPMQILKSQPPAFDLYDDAESVGGWPQWNELKEKELHQDLMATADIPPHIARSRLSELEKRHAARRRLPWAELDEAPLAIALEHLSVLAEVTKTDLVAGNLDDLMNGYFHNGWKADDAALRALATIESSTDFAAVTNAIRSVYFPWTEDSSRYLQMVAHKILSEGQSITSEPSSGQQGECILFVDGLRFDLAMRLSDLLKSTGIQVKERSKWSALPSVTATGKPAVTPVKNKITGQEISVDFEPIVAESGKSLKGGYHLKKLLADNGWQFLDSQECGDVEGRAWSEYGAIDHEGHNRGWKLARQVDLLLLEIRDRIVQLLNGGWSQVRVVTDHGWLLMPGGLPKIELDSALTENKWGRCASLKAGATPKAKRYPWFWDSNQYLVLADGISCFHSGEEYSHGGLSFQECFTLELTVAKRNADSPTPKIKVKNIVWKGLRCTVELDNNYSGLSIDLRTQAGDSSSSIVITVKPLGDDGIASVIIEDEDLEGQDAVLVVINSEGSMIAQFETVIGGGSR